ncbi:hypothetical protein KO465_08665 [Candidatus Micrarchaeota archaeon]|nr:hypothetical protein [Candidatus Micrarchaeota archaeon]
MVRPIHPDDRFNSDSEFWKFKRDRITRKNNKCFIRCKYDDRFPSYAIINAKKYISRGKITSAISLLEKSISANPTPASVSMLISAYGKVGKTDKAEAVFEAYKSKMLSKAFSNSIFYVFINHNDIQKAEQYFLEYIEKGHNLCPLMVSALINLYYLNGEYDFIENFVSNLPHDLHQFPDIQRILAESHRKNKKYGEAIKIFNRIIRDSDGRVDINYINSVCGRAYCLHNLGFDEIAFDELTKLEKNVKTNNPAYYRIICGIVYTNAYDEKDRQRFLMILLNAQTNNLGNKDDVESAIRYLSK